MKILITGSTGLVGEAVASRLESMRHAVRRLVRPQSGPWAGGGAQPRLEWDPERGLLDRAMLEGFDAIVHLAGENIAARRWTNAQKQRIRDSRIDGTRLLSSAVAGLARKPRVLVGASAIGFYGDRADEILDESASMGVGFLADVCRSWEEQAQTASNAGVRTVQLRLGVVLSPEGGALAKMLPPFRAGLGGRIGSGRQYMSWITLDDVVGAIVHAIDTESLSGPVNAVAPEPQTNEAFSRALGRTLGRPSVLPLPAFAARLLMGEMADELLLASTRVRPRRLLSSGYRFRHSRLEPALRSLLGREGTSPAGAAAAADEVRGAQS